MNEFVLSFHTRKGKKRGAWVTRHWELLRKGELCFINTHTQIPIRSSEPPAAPVNNRSLSGVCVMRKNYLCGDVCESEGPVLCGTVGRVSV